jgi:hypothetical protein
MTEKFIFAFVCSTGLIEDQPQRQQHGIFVLHTVMELPMIPRVTVGLPSSIPEILP